MTRESELAALDSAVRSALIVTGWGLHRMDDGAEPLGPDMAGTLAAAILAALPPGWCAHDPDGYWTVEWFKGRWYVTRMDEPNIYGSGPTLPAAESTER